MGSSSKFASLKRNHKTRPLVERIETSPEFGLSSKQVAERIEASLTNTYSRNSSKSAVQIILQNVCTLFNLINLILFLSLILVGSYKNILFMGVVLSNLLIGTIQELRAKYAVDRLSLISSSKASLIRDGQKQSVPIEDVVADDIILYSLGNQIITDGIIVDGECEVNESFLTGESLPVKKIKGEHVLSGSFITEGNIIVRATHVGRDAYLNTIVSGAKRLKFASSEIINTLKYIIRIISIAIFPIGTALVFRQINLDGVAIQEAIVSVVAALIGMIPEGLMLLTSTVLAVGTIRLSRHGILTRELYCIESLARIDTLCIDKTGTLTEGNLELRQTILLNEVTPNEAEHALNTLAHALKTENATFKSIYKHYFKDNEAFDNAQSVYEFSSRTKWSGITTTGGTTYVIGACEFILSTVPDVLMRELESYSTKNRVILLAKTDSPLLTGTDGHAKLPDDMQPMAFILLKDTIRSTAYETLEFFKKENVQIKIISGDNLITVQEIAQRAGLESYAQAIDVSTLKTREEIVDAANKYSIFARVSPHDKETLIEAMKAAGHKVAMTGDGVNDVLALRAADCSIAMASGSDGAKSVSQFVLTDCDFSSLPHVVAEGRRCINNIQGSASLFLNKTIYATLLSIMFMILPLQYPFEPIQLSLISTLGIGIPSFVLALQPNHDPIYGKFFKNILAKALPGGLAIALSVSLTSYFITTAGFPDEIVSTVCLLVTGLISILVLFFTCQPFNRLRIALFTVMTAMFIMAVTFFPGLFSLTPITGELLLTALPYLIVACIVYLGFAFLFKRIIRL